MTGYGDPLGERERARYDRMKWEKGRHPKCLNEGCNKDCTHCRTCPVCLGTLSREEHQQVLSSTKTEIRISYSCVHCGAVIDRQQIEEKQQIQAKPDSRFPEFCSVRGCQHRTWAGYRITVMGIGYTVCDRHKRFHRRWERLGQGHHMPHLVAGANGLEVTHRRRK